MANKWGEIGTSGLQAWSGFIYEAYNTKLYWPGVYTDFNRIRRSDTEIGGIIRPTFLMMARQVQLDWELPDDANDDELAAQEFGRQVLEDMEGGQGTFLETLVSHVPFMGWGWWEVVPGLRRKDWRPPDKDPWRSEHDDGMVGIRRLAWRDHSAFSHWELDDRTGRLDGLWQSDPPSPKTMIPLDRSLHITFGDPNNPEGLSPLEAVWRLERIKYGLEVVQGIGYEHAAGHLSIKAEEKLGPDDDAHIKKAARAILTAQEGNYAIWPKGFTGEIIDVPFAAAPAILEAIRYYGLLKLQVYLMQWVAMATTADTGAYSAHSDSAAMGIMAFNGMMEGFAKQIDDQVGARLFDMNPDAFPAMERRPRLIITPLEKTIPLAELSQFVAGIASFLPMDDDDLIAIRRKSGFLPETLPEKEQEEAEPDTTEPVAESEEEAEEGIEEAEEGELSLRPFAVSDQEAPADVLRDAAITEADIDRATRRFLRWADEHDPLLAGLMRAEVGGEEPTE